MDKCFVIKGETGSYSDRHEWIVRVFTDLDIADNHLQRLLDLITSLGLRQDVIGRSPTEEQLWFIRQVDPNANCDYDGMHYWIDEAELDTTRLQ